MPQKEVTRRGFLEAGAATATGTMLAFGAEPEQTRKTIFAVEGHMDDIEWGAAGLLFKALKAGYRVVIVQAVSDYSYWPPTQGREKEVKEGLLRITREMKHTSTCTLYGPAGDGYPKKMDLAGYAEVRLASSRRWGEMCGARYAEAFQSIQYAARDIL